MKTIPAPAWEKEHNAMCLNSNLEEVSLVLNSMHLSHDNKTQ